MHRGKLLSTLLITSSIFVYPIATHAADDMTNAYTGTNSTNVNKSKVTISIEVKNEQNATVSQNLNLTVNTGNNNINHNTTVGNVESGSINTAIAVNNDINTGSTQISNTTTSTNNSTDSINVHTGPNSTNINSSQYTSTTTFNLVKNATVYNSVSANLNTGGMNIDHNTSVVNVKTGDVHTVVKITNCINSNTNCTSPTPPKPNNNPDTPNNPSQPGNQSGDKGGGFDMPIISGPVNALVASVTTNAIPLATLTAATSGYFPAGATNTFVQYIWLCISLFAAANRFVSWARIKKHLVKTAIT